MSRTLFGSVSAAALLLVTSQAAWAAMDSQSATFDLEAEVPNVCTLGDFTETSATNVNFSGAGGTYTVEIPDPVDANANLQDFELIAQASAMCNYGDADIELTSSNDGMTGPGAVPGFENVIDYDATVDIDGTTFTLNANDGDGAPASASSLDVGPFTGTIELTIENANNDGPYLAGTYSDTLTLELGSI